MNQPNERGHQTGREKEIEKGADRQKSRVRARGKGICEPWLLWCVECAIHYWIYSQFLGITECMLIEFNLIKGQTHRRWNPMSLRYFEYWVTCCAIRCMCRPICVCLCTHVDLWHISSWWNVFLIFHLSEWIVCLRLAQCTLLTHTYTRINLVARWGDSQLYIPSMLLVRLYVVMTRPILFIRSISLYHCDSIIIRYLRSSRSTIVAIQIKLNFILFAKS